MISRCNVSKINWSVPTSTKPRAFEQSFIIHDLLCPNIGRNRNVLSLNPLYWSAKSPVPFSPCALGAVDKESGERLSRLVEEACMLLADYSGRLAAEIDDRRQLTRTLTVFLQSQRDGLAQNEQKLEVRKLTFLFSVTVCVLCVFTSVSLSRVHTSWL